MQEIQVKIYASEYADWIKINYLLFRKKRPEIWIGVIGSFLIFITSLLILFLIWLADGEEFQIYFLILLSGITFCFVIEFDRKIRRVSRAAHEADVNEFYPRYFAMTEIGFHEKDAHINNYAKWTDFQNCIISKNYILLFNNEDMIYFLSGNYKTEDFEQIKRWVSSKVKIL